MVQFSSEQLNELYLKGLSSVVIKKRYFCEYETPMRYITCRLNILRFPFFLRIKNICLDQIPKCTFTIHIRKPEYISCSSGRQNLVRDY